MAPRLFDSPLLDRAAHFRVSPISSSECRPRRNIYTDSEGSKEEIKVEKIFYIHDLVHARVHTPVLCRNQENRHLRLGTKRINFCLIVTIPTMTKPSQGTNEGPRIYSLGWVSGQLPLPVDHSIDSGHIKHVCCIQSRLLYMEFLRYNREKHG